MTTKTDKELDKRIEEENRSIVQITSHANKVAVIKTNEDLTKAVEFLVKVKNRMKDLEEERQTYTKPINESLRRLNSRFKVLTEPLKTAERGVKDAILVYKKDKEEQRLIEQEAIRKKNGGNKNIVITDAVPDIIESKSGEIRSRKTWTFEVLEEKSVPREYMMVDEKKVKAAIREGERKIKGLKIFQEEDLSTY